ncbi:phage tail protein I [Pseudomonas donghuensis]|uniref:phage tail protein I n=1 Tax=Pseudomonas donghuensis TaxID=1163398 RepID=UPI000C29F158|nr:phage tail protein I [Pseudomonas donghuensis]PJY93783.1 phage tail protein I [Pseudomonas donghuensis]
MKSLLPLNSTPLERAIEAATDEVAEVPLRVLYNPDTCPAHLLHQLAWAWSVGVPGTFALQVGVLETGITEEMYQELTRLIDDAKPVSRHLTGLAITLATSGYLRLAMSLAEGDEIDVYPPTPRDIVVSGTYGHVGREHHIETLDVYS